MRSRILKQTITATVLGAAVAFAPTIADAQSAPKIFRSDTGSPGGPSHTVIVVLGKIWNREMGTSVQINDSQTLTRSALKLGRDQLEVMPFPTSIYKFLSEGSRMYKKRSHEQAIKASKNVRSIWGWQAVFFHPVAFERAGIKDWKDIKGKTVFTGPPSGAAAVTSEAVIRAITGFQPNKDYKAVRLPWGGGLQAMLDGKLDLFMRPVGMGAAMIEQLGLKQKFYILDVGSAQTSVAWKKYMKGPGRAMGILPPNTYQGQINNDKAITLASNTFQMAVRKSLPEEVVYRMTKLTWENLGEIHQTAVDLRTIVKDQPFIGVNMPLHMGAVKYYREKGIKIPANILPPEAK